MKIRTLDELQNAIDREMAWRKKELSAIRATVASSRKFARETAIRAGIALLYAHWEGGIKNIASFYLQYVSSLKRTYNVLKPNFLAITMRSELISFKNTSKTTLQTEIVNRILNNEKIESKIPTEGIINTYSNLNSEVFQEILSTIGLPCDKYEGSYKMIDEILLKKRNIIAHGELLKSLDIDENRYYEIHDKIFNLICSFALQVSNAACLEQYLK